MKNSLFRVSLIYALIFTILTGGFLPTSLSTFTVPTAQASGGADITLSNNAFFENSNANLTIGTLGIVGAEWGGTTPTFTLISGDGDDDNYAFKITGSTLATKLSGIFDYEGQSTFSIRVRGTTTTYTTVKTFTLNLMNVNEAPAISSVSNQILTEDTYLDLPVSAFDPEGVAPIISVTGGSTSTVSASIINSTTIRLTPASNYFTSTPIQFEAKATDGEQSNLGSFSQFTITVNPVNDAPTTSDSTLTVTEDVSATGKMVAIDVENDPITYSIETQPTRGTLVLTNANTGAYSYTPFENQNGTDSFTFRTSDYEFQSNISTVSIQINSVNDAPTDISLSKNSIAENNVDGATIGTFNAIDIDSANFTYVLVAGSGSADNSSFTISTTNELRAALSFDFETKSSYSIRVEVSDGFLTYAESFTITVTNVNEVATAITLSSSTVAENAGTNATIGTLSNNDPEQTDTFTYTLVSGIGSTDNGNFNIFGTTLRATNSLNFESQASHAIRVRVTDGTLSHEQMFTITVTDVNELPTNVLLSKNNIDENNTVGAIVGTLITTDPDNYTTFTYALVAGTGSTDNASFGISGSSLTAGAAFNFETKSSYSIRVRSTDHGGLSLEQAFTITVNNANETPTGISLSATSIAENNTVGALVGTLSTTDPDAGNTFTYSLVSGTGSTNNASFSISGSNLNAGIAFDFEAKTSYSIRVRTTDQGSLTFEKVFTITVTNVNEAPTALSISATSIAENNVVGANIGNFTTTDPDASNTFTYALVSGTDSTDNSSFTINGSTLKAGIVFDFDTKSSYTIRVRSTDQGSLTFDKIFTITITNVNEVPTDITLQNSSINENNLANALVGALSTTDPDAGNTFTYSLVSGTGSTDNASFTVTGANLTIKNAANYEVKSSYSIRVRTTDQGSLTFDKVFTISVNDVNEAPTSLSMSTSAIFENNAVGATVSTFTTADQDAGNTFTYSLVSGTGSTDNSSFSFNGNVLTANISFNFEQKGSYYIRVRSTDQGGLTYEQSLVVSIVNVNETPSAISLSSTSISENNAVGAAVGTFSTTDPDDRDAFTYTLVSGTGSTDNSAFAISASSLNANSAFNFETKNSYSIRVRSTDQGGLTFEQTFTITVNDVNEAPLTLTLSNSSIAENNSVGAQIGTFSSTDPDDNNTFTFSFVSGTGSTDNTSFAMVDNSLNAGIAFNFETKSSYSIRVRSTDQGGLTFEQTFTITVSDVNEVPTALNLSASSIFENNTAGETIGTFSTTDPDVGNTFTYALVAGTGSTDNGSFTLTRNSLNVNSVLDFESKNSYSIRARTTDQNGLTFEQTFTISVVNVNETPTNISLSSSAINENNTVGATVGSFSTTDPDASNTFTYSLVAGTGATDNASFTISGSNLNAAAAFNFETKSSFSIRVRSTDQGSLTVEKVFSISVNDVNEAPSAITLSNSSIAENNTAGATIGTFSSTDQDSGNTFTYALVSGTGSTDNTIFSISGSTLSTTVSFNFETKSSYSIRVRATDQGSLSFEQTFTISVTNVNETPTAIQLSSSSMDENNAVGATVGSLSTTDPDAGNTFTYTLVDSGGSNDNASFVISSSDLKAQIAFNFEEKSSYTVRVRSTDQGGLSHEQTITITVNNVNETPTALTLSANSMNENNTAGATVGSFSTSDPDTSNTFTYSLVVGTGSTDNSSFTISGSNLSVNNALNFETKSSYQIRVRSTDQGGLFIEQAFTITVVNVNETPTAIAISANSIAENNAVGDTVGTLSTTDEDSSNTFTYTLVSGTGSTDNSSFTISGNSLMANIAFNFEAKTNYSIRIRTTDQGSLTFEQGLTITITNVNETPTALSLSSTTVAENNTIGSTVGALSTTDVDAANTFTYQLVSGTGATDNASFAISGANLTSVIAFDFESKTSYSIRVRTTDQGGLSFEQAFTITITNVNETPTEINLSNTSITENNTSGATLGTLSTNDPDASSTFTYSLVTGTGSTDNASFTISGTSLRVNGVLNFETKSSLSIRVRATDQGGLTFEKIFTITVLNQNETPTWIALSTNSIDENSAPGTTVGTISTTDPDVGNTFIYEFVSGTGSANNVDFTITGSTLSSNNTLDYESKAYYSLRIRTTDQGGLSFEKTFTINVVNVPEAPTDIHLSNSSMNENAGPNATVGQLTATDPDIGNIFVYSLVTGIGSDHNNRFNIIGNTLRASTSLDFETLPSMTIRVRVSDGSFMYEKAFPITVVNVNEAPTDLTLTPSNIDENKGTNAKVGLLAHNAPDGDNTFTFTLISGTGSTDNNSFNINGRDLIAKNNLDYETKSSYSVRIRVANSEFTLDKSFVISVNDLNESPTEISLSGNLIDENEPVGTVIGSLSALDPDAISIFSYSLVNGAGDEDNAQFLLTESDLVSNSSYDFETKSEFSIRVQVSDGSITFEDTFTIYVMDINEAPTNITISNDEILENSGINYQVGALSTIDQDSGNTFTYALISGDGSTDNANFNINGSNLRASTNFDFETNSTYSIRIKATDQDGLSFEKKFTINILNGNEAPTSLTLSNNRTDENVWIEYTIGEFSTNDPDGGSSVPTYTLVSGEGDDDNANFIIAGNILKSNIVFKYDEQKLHLIRARVTDSGGKFFEKSFVIEVTQANAVLNAANNQVTIYFSENIFNAQITLADLKNSITMTSEANVSEPSYSALNIEDEISIKKNTLIIKFKTAITGQYNRIKIGGNALKDSFNNMFTTEQITSPLVVDTIGPKLVRVQIIKKNNKEIELLFSEKIYIATPGLKPADRSASFKAAIQISRNASDVTPTYVGLGLKDKVTVGQRKITFKLYTPLTGSDNKITLPAEALKDLLGNTSLAIETPIIELDSQGPILKKVTLAKDNKTITIVLNEEAFYVMTLGTKLQKLAALKAAISITADANSAVPTYSPLALADIIEMKKDTLTIKLSAPLSGDQNRIHIASEILKDLFGNTNLDLTTSILVADEIGPIVTSVVLPPKKYNLQIVVQFNESISNALTVPKIELKAALKTAVTISSDAESETPTFVALKTTDRVSVKDNKGQLIIDLSAKLVKDINYKVRINAETLRDLTGNKSLEIITQTFTVDVTGPELR
jgi:hypothetical protein